MPFPIDSNVLIDVSRGNTAAIKYVDGLADSWALSQVTQWNSSWALETSGTWYD
jgi:hypothetical protein